MRSWRMKTRCAHIVDDHIDTGPGGQVQDCLDDIVGPIVDHGGGAQGAGFLQLFRAGGGGDHPGASHRAQLQGGQGHAAADAVYQDGLPRSHRALGPHHAPCGQVAGDEGGGLGIA